MMNEDAVRPLIESVEELCQQGLNAMLIIGDEDENTSIVHLNGTMKNIEHFWHTLALTEYGMLEKLAIGRMDEKIIKTYTKIQRKQMKKQLKRSMKHGGKE